MGSPVAEKQLRKESEFDDVNRNFQNWNAKQIRSEKEKGT